MHEIDLFILVAITFWGAVLADDAAAPYLPQLLLI
jgi:hypothetical protein